MAFDKKVSSEDASFSSYLICQRCANPFKLSSSFKELEDDIFTEFGNAVYLNTDKDDPNVLSHLLHRRLENSAMRKVVVPVNICDATSDFMVVGELTSLPLDSTQSIRITDAISNLTSDQSDFDHPICEICADNILDQMDVQLNISEEDTKLYQKNLEKVKEDNDEDLEALQEELKELKKEEAVLEAQLNEIEAVAKRTKETLKIYESESETLEREEKKHWNEYFKMKHQFLLTEDSHRSVQNQLLHTEAHLNKLISTDVFNTTFHIWHSGHFGTINGFRLGRLPKEPVEWPEINAAWGQTVLLLHSLAAKTELTFERYRLVPYGNHSYIVPLDNKSKDLPLYCLGGIKYVLDHRFDHAMVAFLDCLQQFKEKVKTSDETFHLPYRMEKGKIEDKSAGKSYSIKIHLNSQEQWTKALKFMLTNLKWALAWVSTQFHSSS